MRLGIRRARRARRGSRPRSPLSRRTSIQLAVTEVELDAVLVRPLDRGASRAAAAGASRTSHPRARAAQSITSDAVRQEHEPAARPQQPRAPRGSSGTGRTRCSRRTRRRRGRSSRPAAARPLRSPRRAGTRGPVSRLQRGAPSRAAPGSRRRPPAALRASRATPRSTPVPQPSSTTSSPSTSPRTPSSVSGTPKTPQVISSVGPRALGGTRPCTRAFDSVQSSRLRAT